MTVSDGPLRNDELGFARQCFTRLASRTGDDTLIGEYTQLNAEHVSALGHLGNYHYFLLLEQPEHALLAAYQCTERFPALGVRLFPTELFSRDYRQMGPGPDQTRAALEARYLEDRKSFEATRRRYRLDLAWRLPAAAGYVIAGLAASPFAPTMAARGVLGAAGLLATSEEGLLPQRGPDRQAYLQQASATDEALSPVRAEARARRIAVQKRISTGG
jgi:hypothetical protein